jgi:hypothetical protein
MPSPCESLRRHHYPDLLGEWFANRASVLKNNVKGGRRVDPQIEVQGPGGAAELGAEPQATAGACPV